MYEELHYYVPTYCSDDAESGAAAGAEHTRNRVGAASEIKFGAGRKASRSADEHHHEDRMARDAPRTAFWAAARHGADACGG